MKRFKKNLTLSNVLLLSVIVLLVIQKCDNNSLKETLSNQHTITEQRLNRLGEKVYEVSGISFDDASAKILTEIDFRFAELDNRLKANNRNIKDLQTSVSFMAESKGEQIAKVDTVYRNNTESSYFPNIPGWKYSDEVISIHSSLLKDTSLLQSYFLKNLKFSVDVFAKNRFLKPTQYFADITSPNPNISISNANVLIKKYPKPIISLGVGVGAVVTPDFTISPGLQLGIYKPLYTIYK